MSRRVFGVFAIFLSVAPRVAEAAIEFRADWLAAGQTQFQAFSPNPERLPSYQNRNTRKSFSLDAYWRHPINPRLGFDVLAFQAGRTLAQLRVGDYQTNPMRVSIQTWHLVFEPRLEEGKKGFLSGLAGVSLAINQFEHSRNILIEGQDVSAASGLDPAGSQQSGVRSSVENAGLTLGARGRRESGEYFIEGLLIYSFLYDLTDVLNGSSPFSGWLTHGKFFIGRKLGKHWELFAGYTAYVDHMAAPTGQGGLKLRGGPSAPEGVYLLWQENEVQLDAALLGLGYKF